MEVRRIHARSAGNSDPFGNQAPSKTDGAKVRDKRATKAPGSRWTGRSGSTSIGGGFPTPVPAPSGAPRRYRGRRVRLGASGRSRVEDRGERVGRRDTRRT